jgi:hypothetical protein
MNSHRSPKRGSSFGSRFLRAAIATAISLSVSVAVQTVSISSADAYCQGEGFSWILTARNGRERSTWTSTCDDDKNYHGRSIDDAPGNGYCAIVEHEIGKFGTWSKFWNCYDEIWVNFNYVNDGDNQLKLCESGVGCSDEHRNHGY